MKKLYIIILFASIGAIAQAQTWAPFGTNNLNIAVTTMIVDTSTNTLYVGGNSGVAEWNGSSWDNLGTLSGIVNSLAIYNGELYAGGNLPSSSNIVKWNGSSWTTVTTGTSGPVGALAVYDNKLAVTGSFTTSGGIMTFGFANWDGTTWSNFGAGYPNNPSGSLILTLPVINGQLYVAGGQLSLFSDPYACIANLTGTAWSDATAGAGLTMASVYSLAVHNGELYAGGSFTGVASRIAKWNGTNFIPVGTGMDGTVFSLLSFKNELYAGGAFTLADGDTARHIAKWDGSNWAEVADGMGIVGNAPWVLALTNYDSCLIAGGQFTTAGGNPAANIAKLCNPATGFMEHQQDNIQMAISPNPFTSSTTLQTKNLLNNATLTVDNCLGQTVKKIKNISGHTVTLSRDNLPSGLYFIRLTEYNKLITTDKLVITD